MSKYIMNISDDNFETEVLKSDIPVLVDFWAEWCGPCKMIAPALEEVAEHYAGKLKVTKLNIDDNENTPPTYNIRGIPTLLLFKNGELLDSKTGALSKAQMMEFIEAHLSHY